MARRDQTRQHQAAEAHATHEGAQQDAQRHRRRSDHQFEQLKPDDLVNQRRAAAADEQHQQRRQIAARGQGRFCSVHDSPIPVRVHRVRESSRLAIRYCSPIDHRCNRATLEPLQCRSAIRYFLSDVVRGASDREYSARRTAAGREIRKLRVTDGRRPRIRTRTFRGRAPTADDRRDRARTRPARRTPRATSTMACSASVA